MFTKGLEKDSSIKSSHLSGNFPQVLKNAKTKFPFNLKNVNLVQLELTLRFKFYNPALITEFCN